MRYIIIGGGAAGIAAAHKILESSKKSGNTEVVLLEASGEYGGRASTMKLNLQVETETNEPSSNANTNTEAVTFFFDTGCMYIQDPERKENPWKEQADELLFETLEEITKGLGNLSLYNDKTNAYDRYRENENNSEWADQLYSEIWKRVTGIQSEYSINKLFTNKAVMQFKGKEINGSYFLSQVEALAIMQDEHTPIRESADPWQYLAADRDREETNENWGKNLFVREGLGNLVKACGKKLDGKPLYKMEQCTVKQIDYDSNKNTVTVTGNKGEKYEGGACIITVSVGVLKASGIQFNPSLPPSHLKALKHLEMGGFKKLVVQLAKMPEKNIFGNNDTYTYYLPAFENPDKPENASVRGVWCIFRQPYFPPSVLMVFAAGSFAKFLDGFESAEMVFDYFRISFEAAYKGAKLKNVCFTKDWMNDPLFRGAYSYTSVAKDKNDGINHNKLAAFCAREVMSIPVGKELYFAGEAYNTGAYGTLHGAYADGLKKGTMAFEDHRHES